MKKSLKTLTLLLFMPCLMANALGPSNYYSEYFSLNIEYVSSTQVEDTYYHTYHINNHGGGYVNRISIRDGDNETYHIMELNGENISDTFHNALLGPSSSSDITIASNYPIIDTSNNVSYAANAYKSGGIAYALKELKGVEYAGHPNEFYKYKIEFKSEHSYDAIIQFDYDGNNYYVISKTGGGYDHCLYTLEEIDLEKLSIKDFFFIEPHQAFKVDEDAFTRAMYIFIAGFLFVASLIVFPAVFIPAMVRRSRRKKAKAAKK